MMRCYFIPREQSHHLREAFSGFQVSQRGIVNCEKLRGDRRASGQVPQQYRRARPPCHQTTNQAYARLQGFSLRPHPSLRYRAHAHDQQRANERRWQGTNSCTAVLRLGCIRSSTVTTLECSGSLIATEPDFRFPHSEFVRLFSLAQ